MRVIGSGEVGSHGCRLLSSENGGIVLIFCQLIFALLTAHGRN